MLNILIVDDEQVFVNSFKQDVKKLCEDNNIKVKITAEDDPLSVIDDEKFLHNDILLLDIDMPDISGMQIASQINEKKGNSDKPYIVFVTNKDELVFDALKVQPFSFVRKSHMEDLTPCLLKIHQKLFEPNVYSIKTGREIYNIYVDDIIYLEKKNNYVLFHTQTGLFKERSNIDSKVSDLTSYGFLRPHIGYLVNARYVEEIRDTVVLLSIGKDVPLSKKYRKSVKHNFYEWMVNRR